MNLETKSIQRTLALLAFETTSIVEHVAINIKPSFIVESTRARSPNTYASFA